MDIKRFEKYADLIEVLDVLPIAVAMAEANTRTITYLNPVFSKLSGYASEELIGQPQTILHPPIETENEFENNDSFAKHLKSLQADHDLEALLLPQQLVHKDGHLIDVDISASLLEIENQKLMIGFFNPVTERVLALQELSAKEQELDAIIQNSTVGIMFLKGYRILHRANQRLADIFGYDSPQEMIGISMRELHVNETNFIEFGQLYYETLRHRQNLQIEYQFKKKNGEIVWIVISGKAIDNNVPADLNKGVIWVLDDISEKKRLEHRLAAETERYKSLMTLSADAIFILSLDRGEVLEFSDLACPLLGYAPEEVAGLTILDWDKNMTPDDYHKMVEHIGFEPISFERIHTRKDGSQYNASISARRIESGESSVIHAIVRDITEQKLLEERVKKERNLFRGGPTVVFTWVPEKGWPVKSVSHNIDQVMGYSADEVLSDDFVYADCIHPLDIKRVEEEVADYFAVHAVEFEQSYRFKVASGDFRNFYDYTRVDYDSRGNPISIYGYLIDMTEYLKHQQLSQLLLETTSEGIFGIDESGKTTFANPAALRMLGFSEKELVGRMNHAVIHHSDFEGKAVHAHDCNMMKPLQTGEDIHVYDEVLWRRDGSNFPVEYRSTPVTEDGKITGVVVSFHDISEHKEQEKTITRLAYLDSLTELPNRRYFNQTLTERLHNLKYSKRQLVLIMLDLDHFKDINDSLGHPVGDALLLAFAQRVQSVLRDTDFFARLGGDEFAILSKVKEFKDVSVIAQKILDAMLKPFEIEGHSILTNVSIGIAEANRDGSADKLISRADIALYKSKLNGRGQFSAYQTGMDAHVKEELNLLSQLSHAVERNEFRLAFQPQIETATDRVIGIEALIRWQPGGEVPESSSSPAVFIPLAERRGLIGSITEWTVQELVANVKALDEVGYIGHISLNLSSELLVDPSIVQKILQPLIMETQNAIQFDIEITETAFANLQPNIVNYLNELDKSGISLSIDDFGTGYSSLSMLRTLNSTYVKIDKEFIEEVHSNDDDYAIVSATISMAHKLGKKVVAEGVENEAQLACLQKLKCDVLQGYYFAKPMFLDELIGFLKKRR